MPIFDRERFFGLLEEARAKRSIGELTLSLRYYEAALRMVTPDDEGYARIFALKDAGFPICGVSEAPHTDQMDSQIRSEMVAVLRELHRFEEAYHHARIAHYLDDLLHGSCHNDTAASLLDLGLVEFERGRIREAEGWLRQSQEADDALGSASEDWRVKWRMLVRADLWAGWGFLAEAVNASLTLLSDIEDRLSPYQLVQQLNSGAQFLQNLCEHRRAQKLLERAIGLQREAAPDHPQLGRLFSHLSILLHEQLDFVESDRYACEATRFARFAPEISRRNSLPRHLVEERAQVEAWRQASRRHFEAGGASKPNDILLSFSTRDEATVEGLHDALEATGLRTWWFKEQADWKEQRTDPEIRERVFGAIRDSHLIVCVGSSTSFTSQFVSEEVEYSISVGSPCLIWYPEGVRLRPQEAAQRSTVNPDHLLRMLARLFRPGVFAFYGYGLRGSSIHEVAIAIRERFAAVVPGHPASSRVYSDRLASDVLCPTRLLPTVVDAEGRPIFPTFVR